MDRADEIAAEIYKRVCEDDEREDYIAERLRQYAAEAVAAERERCKGWVRVLTPHEPDCSVYNAAIATTHECVCRRSVLLNEIDRGNTCGSTGPTTAAQIREGESKCE